MILIVAAFLQEFRDSKYVAGAFYGLRPASTALITAAGLVVVRETFWLTGGVLFWQGIILAAVLLNSGAADYVVTGCGTGEGAMLACNSFPGVLCGHVADPLDAYTFAQVNDGNAVAMPFALKNGWGQELNLEYTFEKLFGFGSGNGYPAERVEPEQRNKKILDGVRAVTMRPLVDVLGEIDQDLVKGALAGEHFQEYFFANATDEAIVAKVKEILSL